MGTKNVNSGKILKTQFRNDSVLRPSNPASRPCDLHYKDEALHNAMLMQIDRKENQLSVVHAVAGLMLRYGLRISEAISIKGTDVDSDLQVYVKGRKGSDDRYCQIVDCVKFWLMFKGRQEAIGDVFSRYFFYREFKKRGWEIRHGDGGPGSVTHAMRHMHIRKLSAKLNNTEEVRKLIGHKNIKSTEHYVRKGNK